MRKKEIAALAVEALEKLYPDAVCSLSYDTPFQLLIATRLSAQCTDKRVNLVTPKLFENFPDAKSLASAPLADIEQHIKSCGLYKTKASDIKKTAEIIHKEYGGVLPQTMDELTSLPGIGRKTANLIMGDIYGKPAVVCDTHFIRITNRLGLTESSNPLRVEKDLIKLLPPEKSSQFCHRIVLFGRDICTSRNPKCEDCTLSHFCPKNFNYK